MSGLLVELPLLFAQAQNTAPGGGAGAGGGATPNLLVQYLPFVAIIGLWFYLLLVRPQQKEAKQRQAMMSSLKKNDKVVTSSGIYGTIHSVDSDDDRVVVRIDDDKGVKVAFTKAAIVRVLDGSPAQDRTAKAKTEGGVGG
jgi:preprotein translocase subunit YajC